MKRLLTSWKSQRGAMFGLDARLALVIFGTLSVVAGATMINYVSQTNTTAMVTEMNNLSSGYNNFKLTTGADTLKFDHLIRPSGHIGWSGPYLTINTNNHPIYGEFNLVQGPENVSGDPTVITCKRRQLCYVWLKLTEVPTQVAIAVDQAVDGKTEDEGDTPEEGVFRHESDGSGQTHTVFYRLSRCPTSPCQ